jgi:hypothetical protein
VFVQYCALEFAITYLLIPLSSTFVHGAEVLSANRQPKSFSALAMNCDVGSKLGGLIPGTPPSGVGGGPLSQTAKLPRPAPVPND